MGVWCKHGRTLENGHTNELMFFQVVPGTLHIDVSMGGKLGAHPIIRGGTSFNVLDQLGLKSLS